MNRSANLSSPSYLPTLFGSASPGASLLATLSGYSGPAGVSDPIAALEEAKAAQPILVARTAREPRVKRDLDQFMQALATATSPEDFLAAPGALKVLLVSSGLADQTGETELATRLLLSDPDGDALQIDARANPRWSDLREACSFADTGLANLSRPIAIDGIARRYAEAIWRMELAEKTPWLSTALDFLSRADSIRSVVQIAEDPTFRKVVSIVLGIPEQIARALPHETIGTRVDLTKFQERSFIEDLARRFLLAGRYPAGETERSWSGSTTKAAPLSGLVV